ncbi:hypothetical protein SELMODRAFT_106784 [Selaginella moellendorffii]|uniref:non-specific serine/threonine protein kinase n=1 Tax=Selaginella moellendorffii TaxID=88036 RepID=D8S1X3_SELML|nr:serine/threonine-protein kinase D6PKL1 [Selaginella moellendorffii]EFJ21529.1 hypothetical protein SELMODRAFT_106784 [Selaginella moellendorffii]|eukprot:XP_002977525.1 serine/threonine-protein kinase D6PKL1 [Selaginella moellendorffii]
MLSRSDSHGSDLVPGYESDDFNALKRLGYGDMGTVFLATLRNTGQPLAMKVMNKEVVKARHNQYRVERELEILSMLSHPFTPKLFSHFESKKNIYFVMDYCPGGDMNRLRQRQPEKRFSENAARFYAAEVCLAIEYLHKAGIIYRDLKPENVLIQEDGHIMLTDFDLSVRIEQDRDHHHHPGAPAPAPAPQPKQKKMKNLPFMCSTPLSVDVGCAARKAVDVKPSHRPTKKIFPSEMRGRKGAAAAAAAAKEIKSQSFVGTEEYVAPEMILGSGHGKPLDWWTLGIFLYEMIYGVTPFKGRNRRETFLNILSSQPAFPGDWTEASDLISKLLAKDPTKRLGCQGGAEEIKSHAFFRGVDWEAIQHVARPPWVPEPLAIDEERMEVVTVDELLKQTMPATTIQSTPATTMSWSSSKVSSSSMRKEEEEIDSRRSSSSTISYEFSDNRERDCFGEF